MKIERVTHPNSPPDRVSGGAAPFEIPSSVRLEGVRSQALDTSRNRMIVTAALMMLAFTVISGRLVSLAAFKNSDEPVHVAQTAAPPKERADIVDRNGELLATSLPVASLYANPHHVLDPKQAAQQLATVFPEMDVEATAKRLSLDGSFVWLRRNLTPEMQFRVNALGLPGLYFQKTEKRIYPFGRLVSHVMGVTDIDGGGLSGLEKYFNDDLYRGQGELKSSIDVRLQSVLREELDSAMQEFRAIGATGIVMDVHTGEVLAMVSLPDFDPNHPTNLGGEAGFNRATKGVYEMGSTMKLFTAAIGLDVGAFDVNRRYDTTSPIHIGRFTIHDYHPESHWLSVPEIMEKSSNIGAGKMALDIGTPTQKKYMGNFGLLTPAKVEIPEIGSPLSPDKWREINTITIAYGHGIAVSPLQLITAVSAIANGGILPKPTLLKVEDAERRPLGPRIISRETSRQVRELMRDVVVDGTGKMADVVGYDIGGKTGTADKAVAHGYNKHSLLSSFIGVFPIDAPEYAVLAILDEPKGNKKTYGFATGGWVAAPVVKRVVAQMGPIMGLLPADPAAIQAEIEAEQKKQQKKLVVAKPAATGSKPKVTPVAAR